MTSRRHPSRATLGAILASAIALWPIVAAPGRQATPAPAAPRDFPAPIVLNDDGGWCWFQDERALVIGGRLIFGSVAAGRSDPSRRGMVEATSVDLGTGASTRFRLSATPVEKAGRYDDHDTPAFVARGDGRLVAVWAGHGYDNRILSRVSLRAGDATAWSDERVFVPSPSSSVTYSNLHRLAAERGRIYDFFRGLDNRFKPSVAWSDDEGESWRVGGVVIDVPAAFRHRPYVKYASDGRDTVHLAYTDGHPRNYDNSLYHAFYRAGMLHRSDGHAIRSLTEGLRDPVEGTRIFRGDARNVAWVTDLELDAQGRPFVGYSVQKDSAGLPPGQGGADHRYRLAVWTGTQWDDREIAFAGSRLYAGEDDYTGGIALVPGDPTRLFISTDADPSTGAPLVSAADRKRHWEVFRGATADGGRTWRWQPVTRDSMTDNLRPIVPRTSGREELLLWLRGRYRSYTDYDLEVVGLLPAPGTLVADLLGHAPGASSVPWRAVSSPTAARSQAPQCYHATEATMATITRRAATEKDLRAMPKDGQKYELVDGQIRVSPAGDRHSVVALTLGSRLLAFAKRHQLGHVCGADAGFRLPGGNVRSPDASFIKERTGGRLPLAE